ncbi:hypothetical protein NM208_g11995 [Fusarium decemcellulare]|uniref:Uncharacterized protein n=1 Tax=Fusarium decemcellulare TaxID=57161 RepID=A0ACC1RR41_9HYPO|nr:hypothetical protein NM208_g11995 [Fusarium decemcellulare]
MASATLGRGVPPRDGSGLQSVPCALLFDHPEKPGKWKPIIPDASLCTTLIKHSPSNSAAYLGLRLSFLREKDDKAFCLYGAHYDAEDANQLGITCKLPADGYDLGCLPLDKEKELMEIAPDGATFYLTTVKLHEGHNMIVSGFGLPFRGVDEAVDSWVNRDEPIQGIISLKDLLDKRELTLLIIAATGHLDSFFDMSMMNQEPFHYGYGNYHKWDLDRYAEQVPTNRGLSFEPKIAYDNMNQRDTAITQMHVQDVLDYDAALGEIANLPVPTLKWPHLRAARRALRGDRQQVRLYISLPSDASTDDPIAWEGVHIAGYSELIEGLNLKHQIPVELIQPVDKDNHHISLSKHDCHEEATKDSTRLEMSMVCQSGIMGEKKRVDAVTRLKDPDVWPTVMLNDPLAKFKKSLFNTLLIGQGLWDTFKKFEYRLPTFELPTFDILDQSEAVVRDACLDLVQKDDRQRFKDYFGNLHLGLGFISSPPGTGKSHVAAIITILMCSNASIRRVYVSAPSNVATDNILKRIDSISTPMVKKLIAAGTPAKHLMLVRGYNIFSEMEACAAILNDKSPRRMRSPWQMEWSLCWWTLRVLGSSAVPPLTSDDCPELWDLHQEVDHTLEAGSYHYDLFVNAAKKPGSESIIARSLEPLMSLVLRCADVVATTPATSAGKIYQDFNNTLAKAVVFDEAGAMFRSDGLVVFGNTPRPMVAVGDDRQFAPVLVTALELLNRREGKDRMERIRGDNDGFPTNRFADDAEISWLTWFAYLGWPVFYLYTQHRMAVGQFDLSLETVYPDIKPYFSYDPSCLVVNFPMGLKVERYLCMKHSLPSSMNKLEPVFFNCKKCPCRNPVDYVPKLLKQAFPQSSNRAASCGASRLNPRANDCVAKELIEMIKALSLSPRDIAVLTPYRINMRSLQKRFHDEPLLRHITCSTIEGFQGGEAEVVVLVLCVDRNTGPSFVAEPRRLNVAVTRQKSSLLIFGDINTLSGTTTDEFLRIAREDGGEAIVSLGVMRNMFRMLGASKRVVELEGDETIDPDEYWGGLEVAAR